MPCECVKIDKSTPETLRATTESSANHLRYAAEGVNELLSRLNLLEYGERIDHGTRSTKRRSGSHHQEEFPAVQPGGRPSEFSQI